jgi:hypothetical protein
LLRLQARTSGAVIPGSDRRRLHYHQKAMGWHFEKSPSKQWNYDLTLPPCQGIILDLDLHCTKKNYPRSHLHWQVEVRNRRHYTAYTTARQTDRQLQKL